MWKLKVNKTKLRHLLQLYRQMPEMDEVSFARGKQRNRGVYYLSWDVGTECFEAELFEQHGEVLLSIGHLDWNLRLLEAEQYTVTLEMLVRIGILEAEDFGKDEARWMERKSKKCWNCTVSF